MDVSPPLETGREKCAGAGLLEMVYRQRAGFGKAVTQPASTFGSSARNTRSAHARPLAALAFDHPVALLQQALALAILALLLLLDVGAFFVGHDNLPAQRFADITMIHPRIAVYKCAADLRTAMMTRRELMLSGTAVLLAATVARPASAAPPAAPDPVAIVTAIYTRAAKGKGNGGGAFIIENKAAKAKYLSKALVKLWAEADAHTPKGDVGPVDFDPVTNSQEPDLKSFNVAADKLEADKAVIAVTLIGHGAARSKPADNIIRYNFVREDGQWKIDDISGASDGEAWSIREILKESLKELT
jgi:hypothetical protein